jgi:uncharacterized protein
MRVVGLDLAGSERRDTGFCSLDERLNAETSVLHSDQEITERTFSLRPGVVSIDAPLFLPRGRKSLEQRGPPHLRACDRELLRMRIRFFPISLGPMRMLTERGMRLRRSFEGGGLKVIESFPGAVQDILGMPRKQKGIENLRRALMAYGINGDVEKPGISDDELDAISCAMVGKMYVEDDYLAIGDEDEGLMILPRKRESL